VRKRELLREGIEKKREGTKERKVFMTKSLCDIEEHKNN
jgi:hypothetical protein